MFTTHELQSVYNLDRKLQRYEKCLQQIHTAQKKNYPTFKEMVEDIQYKAQRALEN